MVMEKTHKLTLHNDNENSFEYVIVCLIRFCKHEPLQAEQCAMIVHNNESCDISSGCYAEMELVKENLEEMGLKVSMDSYESSLY
jgi:ATP-dependent Clp protease adaptor protein ClpS